MLSACPQLRGLSFLPFLPSFPSFLFFLFFLSFLLFFPLTFLFSLWTPVGVHTTPRH